MKKIILVPLLFITTLMVYSQNTIITPPSEKVLGCPIYPGAQLDTSTSFMLGENFSTYIFTSKDTASIVRDFYQKHFGKEPLKATSGYGTPSYNFQKIFPKYQEDFLSVMTDPKQRRTVIMVVRTGKD